MNKGLPKPTFTMEEIARLFNISYNKVRQEIKEGRLGCFKIGRKSIIRREDLVNRFGLDITTSVLKDIYIHSDILGKKKE